MIEELSVLSALFRTSIGSNHNDTDHATRQVLLCNKLFDHVVCLCFQLGIECLFSSWNCCEQTFRVYTTATICNLNFQSNNCCTWNILSGYMIIYRIEIIGVPSLSGKKFTFQSTTYCKCLRPEPTISKIISLIFCYFPTRVAF